MNQPLLMTVQTIQVDDDGAALRSIDPDPKDGLYHDIPLMILDKASRNGAVYDKESAIKAMTDANTRFGINVREGNQEGEWGHPFASKNDLERMVFVDRKNVSHYIRAIRFKDVGGHTVVFGDVGHTGPYGQYLVENFADPNRNVSFSLRAITVPVGPGGTRRQIRIMVTFDAVDGPGFAIASKRHMTNLADTESLIGMNDLLGISHKEHLFATEAIEDQQILDMFQTSGVRVVRQEFDCYDPRTRSLGNMMSPDDRRVSAVHEMLRRV
jgi:hypothetical protein